jgi:hypothetical protein
MKAELVSITPKKAKEWLEMNTSNRPMSKSVVAKYAEDIRSGRWKVNGEGIIMNGSRLLDGQHRLAACVAANAPFTSLVVWGVDDEAFDTIDQGAKRTAGNILSIAGITNASHVASAYRWTLVIGGAVGKKGASAEVVTNLYTPQRALEFYENNPGIQRSVRIAHRVYDHCHHFPISMIAALHFLASKKDEATADAFFEPLGTGAGLQLGDPRLTIRNKMLDRAGKFKKERLEYVAYMFISAWNAYRSGRKMMQVKWNQHHLVHEMI